MELTEETIGTRPLDDFVSAIHTLYSAQDANRSIWDVWLHANHHAAAIGEEVRKQKPGKKLLDEIADFSMWLFTFALKLKNRDRSIEPRWGYEELTSGTILSFSDVIWKKYPLICPVCFWRRTKSESNQGKDFTRECDCLLYDVEKRSQEQKKQHAQLLQEFARQNSAKKPPTVDGWQDMFGSIYKPNLRHLTLVDVGFHLLEEVGEVSDAIVRTYTYLPEEFTGKEVPWKIRWLEEEIADVYSWLNTLVNSLQLMPAIAKEQGEYLFGKKFSGVLDQKITLSKIIWKRYGDDREKKFWCQKCHQSICGCPIVFVNDKKQLNTFSQFSKLPPKP